MRWAVLGAGLIVTALAGSCAAQVGEQAVDASLIKLHDDLHLSANQEAAWRDYTTAIRPNPDMEARHQAAEQLMAAIPTPRRIALVEANMESDLADLRRQGAAITAFYDQLTPSQQRTFDLETARQPSADGQPPLPPSPSGPSRSPSSPQVVTPPRSTP